MNAKDRQAVWLKHYFDELGEAEDDQQDMIDEYLESVELMLPVVILHLLLAGIYLAQTAEDDEVRT